MESISAIKKNKRRAEQKGDLAEFANCCNLLGAELQENGQFEAALEEHEKELEVFVLLSDKIGEGIAHRRIGEVYVELGDWTEALNHQKKYLDLARESEDLVHLQRAYATLGRTLYQHAEIMASDLERHCEQLSSLKEAETAFLEALRICDKLTERVDSTELSQMRCRVYHNLGLVLDMKGETAKAINFVNQALQLSQNYNLCEDSFRSYSELAIIHLRQGFAEKALVECNEALKIAKKMMKKLFIIDTYCLLGDIHISRDNCIASKVCYYRAHKMKHSVKEARERIETKLKCVISICMRKNLLSKPNNSLDKETVIKNYEKLGDSYSKLGLHSQSIQFYKNTLEESLLAKKDEKYVASIYTSIAQTYLDNKQYPEALEYYKKELYIQLKCDLKEAVKTNLAMARISECLSFGGEGSEDYFQQAYDLADKAKLPNLKMHAIKCHLASPNISNNLRDLLEQQLVVLSDICGIDAAGSDLLSEDEANSTDEDDEKIDLELIAFSDSDEEFQQQHRRQRHCHVFKMKKTNTGDTQLHLAAIKGNVNMVKKLLDQKHAVNVRDNSGWLPIHEACNWGHVEIAELLIDAGSHVNDRGGKECFGITPLHDAAGNGHLDVISLLLRKGATVLVRDDNGLTPLDHLIRYTDDANLSPEELKEFKDMQKTILESMERAGCPVPESVKKKVIETSIYCRNKVKSHNESDGSNFPEILENLEHGCTSRKSILLEEEFCEEIPTISSVTDLWENNVENSATEAYRYAMKNIGSHSKKLDENCVINASVKEIPHQPLIPVDKFVEEWLIDDVGIMSRKRKLGRLDSEYKEESHEQREINVTKKKKSVYPKISRFIGKHSPSAYSKDDHIEICETITVPSEEDWERNHIEYPKKVVKTNSKSNISLSATSPEHSHGAAVIQPFPLRVNIKILNRSLLVPLAPSALDNTVEWLVEEVSKRYLQLYGIKLKLKLHTKTGELNPYDLINMIISSNIYELEASLVEVQDLPPLPHRYSQACQRLGLIEYSEIVLCLRNSESSGILELCHSISTEKYFEPVMQSIQHQNLQIIKMVSCRIKDSGFKLLLDTLYRLPLLQQLELRACSLTAESLEGLCEITDRDISVVKKLSLLDLSYNNFASAKFPTFISLLLFPSLNVLRIRACDLFLTSCSKISNVSSTVRMLELDQNNISLECFANIISLCPHLSHLSVQDSLPQSVHGSGTESSSSRSETAEKKPGIGASLGTLMGAASESFLSYLDLSICKLSDSDLDVISSYINRCSALTYLNLANNSNLSARSVLTLLQEIAYNSVIPLQTLSLHGIDDLAKSDEFIETLIKVMEKKSMTVYPFHAVSLPQSVKSSIVIEQKWNEINAERALITYLYRQLFLKIS